MALAVLTVVAAALPPFVAYVGQADHRRGGRGARGRAGAAREVALGRAVRLVALELGAVAAIAPAASGCWRWSGSWSGSRLGIDVNVRILEKARALELRHFEDAEFYDKLTRARREASTRPLSLVQEQLPGASATG